MLSKAQIDGFWRDGFLVVPNAVKPAELAAMRAQIEHWVEESRAHLEPFGRAADLLKQAAEFVVARRA